MCSYFCVYLQIQQLSKEIKELSLSSPITIFNGDSSSSGMCIHFAYRLEYPSIAKLELWSLFEQKIEAFEYMTK